MRRHSFILFLLMLSISANSSAQESRTQAMGGLSIGIEDPDNQLTPFDFGGNPAWIYMDKLDNYLKISPSIDNSWGNYRRKFDSEGNINYKLGFEGVKTLGNVGTFLGYTSFDYESRRNYKRTLKYDTYAGEAFFFTDTTSGNFTYDGPKVLLAYSWELFPKLYAGGFISYRLMDGLKKVYTYAKTIYREIGCNIGLAYSINDNLVLGANYAYLDNQESVECSDVNLLDVETFNYRGETYFVKDRGATVEQKIRKKESTFSGQFYWFDENYHQLAFQVNYSPANTKILIPEGSFKEVEEGYTSFESFDIQCKAQFNLSDDIVAGFYSGYFNNYSWSRHSHKNLLLWDWNIEDFIIGVGSTYKISTNLLVGVDYIFNGKGIDSSKYIDNRYVNLTSNDHSIKFGAEYSIMDKTYLRVGCKMEINEYDIITGGEDVRRYSITFGVGLPLFSENILDAYVQYSNVSPGETMNYSRSFIGCFITLRLNSF
jgi:hypothetical protein